VHLGRRQLGERDPAQPRDEVAAQDVVVGVVGRDAQGRAGDLVEPGPQEGSELLALVRDKSAPRGACELGQGRAPQ